MQQPKRGEIWLVELSPTQNSIQGGQGGIRPVVITSNNMANTYSPILHGCPVTSRTKNPLPTHVEIDTNTGLLFRSTVLCEQTMPFPRESFIRQVGMCDEEVMQRINDALAIQFGIDINKKEIKTVNIRYA